MQIKLGQEQPMDSQNKRASAPGAQDPEDFTFNDVFSLRRPRDVKAGLSSGSKSAAKGVAVGVLGLVVQPIAGGVQDGFGGFAKGLALGVAGAVLLPVVGIGVGLTQVTRGIWNTPEAIFERSKGRHWNQETREWMDEPVLALSLDDDAFAQTRQRWYSQHGASTSAAGAESGDYYQLLGVARDASPEAIKRQYYVLARRMHPDKNQDDPGAKERFQRLGEAYQVLGNPELRERYDKHGTEGLDVDFMDSAEFFVMLFGSDRFEHLVGELMIAATARNGGEYSPTQMRRMQEAREQRLAGLLIALLRRWVEGDQQGFLESMAVEAAELAKASFGATMLGAVGRVYALQGEIGGSNPLNGFIAGMRQRSQTVKTQASAALLAVKVFQAQSRIERLGKVQELSGEDVAAAIEGMEPSEREAFLQARQQLTQRNGEVAAERARLEEASLPLMLDAMWAANLIDIQSTLRHVCRKVLKDEAVGKGVRLSRAQGLRELGRLFTDAAAKQLQQQPSQPVDPKRQMEDAMQRVIDKRHAMDDRIHAQGQAGVQS